jgi:alpha-N-arabinofuranosidase
MMTLTPTFRLASTLVLLAIASGRSTPAAETVTVTIDASKKGAEINPFIYGQFIEHLGRCIYGGIWAEMLEDRKFYFPITEDYDPYKSLQDTRFPVVGASPWQIMGDPAKSAMVKEASFVGEHTPRIAPGAGIRQRDLAIIQGKRYEGYIWLKADGGPAGSVEVALVWGDEPRQRQTHTFTDILPEYQKHGFAFVAGATTDAAMLEISVKGEHPVFVGTLSLMPADNVRGLRADTLALLKQLNASVYRWPGGNFVSGYDWRDGIGPRDRRPPRKNPAWTGVEHNDFGIDDFIAFCREVNAEPMIATNTGFGDDYSAAQEVEYCNGPASSIGGGWRSNNGHAEPYAVKYWCVGNEMFGDWQLGFMQLSHYVQKHRRVAQKMREADSSIKLVGVGDLGRFNRRHDPSQRVGWSEGMLRECSDTMDYISEHFYRGSKPWEPEHPDLLEHVGMLRESIRERADGHRALQAKLGLLPDKLVPIAMDEWNYWHDEYVYGELGCRYDLTDAMGVAAGLHEYFRNSDIIQMAHYAQTVNVIGCIKTTKTAAAFATTALPLKLYREHFGDVPIATEIAEPLDAMAALAKDGKRLTIGIVNPTEEVVSITLQVTGASLAGNGSCWEITGDDPSAFNEPGAEPRVTIREKAVGAVIDKLTAAPTSVVLYSLNLK